MPALPEVEVLLATDSPEPSGVGRHMLLLAAAAQARGVGVALAFPDHAAGQRLADEARAQLGDKVEVYLDAGPATKQAASTIVDLTGATPRVLREGPIAVAQIAEVLGVEPESLTGEVS